jgi:hypothetical protein
VLPDAAGGAPGSAVRQALVAVPPAKPDSAGAQRVLAGLAAVEAHSLVNVTAHRARGRRAPGGIVVFPAAGGPHRWVATGAAAEYSAVAGRAAGAAAGGDEFGRYSLARFHQERGTMKAWLSVTVATLTLSAYVTGQSAGLTEESQQAFDTPKAAVDSLLIACKEDDSAALIRMFGLRYRDAIAEIDDAEEKEHRRRFWEQSQAHWRIVEKSADRAELIVGRELWAFPIPLVKQSRGWVFATEEGFQELSARRIGENELTAIEVCRAFVQAQREYAAVDHDGDDVLEYAQRIASSPGTRDGLYWEVPAESSEPASPFGHLLAEADGTPKERKPGAPYMGYYYKILTRQGPNPPGGEYDYVINGNMIAGFALVAWPANYRDSGVMTFVVSHHGHVFEKDLGEKTQDVAGVLAVFDPDDSWRRLP